MSTHPMPIRKLAQFAQEHADGDEDAEGLIRDLEQDRGADDIVPQLLRAIIETPWRGLLPALKAARSHHCDENPEMCMCEWCELPSELRLWATEMGVRP